MSYVCLCVCAYMCEYLEFVCAYLKLRAPSFQHPHREGHIRRARAQKRRESHALRLAIGQSRRSRKAFPKMGFQNMLRFWLGELCGDSHIRQTRTCISTHSSLPTHTHTTRKEWPPDTALSLATLAASRCSPGIVDPALAFPSGAKTGTRKHHAPVL